MNRTPTLLIPRESTYSFILRTSYASLGHMRKTRSDMLVRLIAEAVGAIIGIPPKRAWLTMEAVSAEFISPTIACTGLGGLRRVAADAFASSGCEAESCSSSTGAQWLAARRASCNARRAAITPSAPYGAISPVVGMTSPTRQSGSEACCCRGLVQDTSRAKDASGADHRAVRLPIGHLDPGANA
jgi:hypothetical protein